ncbi:MAG TPA: ferrous iron transport protein A [Aquificaceae bacterium]|nr:ferrous iron transport protein A [Aquificaceae bacterium]HIQ31066.1 ferrous iron transport protein A [Aquifex aeolicus]
MSLESLQPGREFTVRTLRSKDSPVVRKLRAMGLKEGLRSKLLLKNGRVYLIQLNNSRLIIDEDTARLVEID